MRRDLALLDDIVNVEVVVRYEVVVAALEGAGRQTEGDQKHSEAARSNQRAASASAGAHLVVVGDGDGELVVHDRQLHGQVARRRSAGAAGRSRYAAGAQQVRRRWS